MSFFKKFSEFEPYEIDVKKVNAIIGGEAGGGGDTGTTSNINLTQGSSGLDNFPDPTYNDGTNGDWTDKDVCS